jgi:hypothetical protein
MVSLKHELSAVGFQFAVRMGREEEIGNRLLRARFCAT